MKSLLFQQDITEQRVPPHWMIGAKTRLIDTWTPQLELIRLPPIRKMPGQVRIYSDEGISWLGSQRRWPRPKTLQIDGWFFDARFDGNANIAHTVISIGLDAAISDAALKAADGTSLKVIVRKNAQPYCVEALRLLGFDVVCTNRPVVGKFVTVAKTGHESAYRLANQYLPMRYASAPNATFGKIYLSRRGVRTVTNDDEVQSYLAGHGYTTVFLEDLPVSRQFDLVINATHVVAIHGASLAALALRRITAKRSLDLVELFGSYMVTCYRGITSNLNGRWSSVRGALDPDAVRALRSTETPRQFQAASFEVDLDALEKALQCTSAENFLDTVEWVLS